MIRTRSHFFYLLLSLVGLGVSSLLAFNLWDSRNRIVSAAIEKTTRNAADAAARIDADLNRFMPLVRALADDLGSEHLLDQNLQQRLRVLLDDNPGLDGIGVAYAPYAYDSKRRLYAPYLIRQGDKITTKQIEDFYDYTDPAIKWYSDPLQHGSSWDEPSWGEASGALMSTYSVPFFRDDGEGRPVVAGVAYISISLDTIGRLIKEIDSGKTGWNLLLSKAGFMIAHPRTRDVTERLNVFTYAEQLKDRVLLTAAKKMTSGQQGFFNFYNPDSGQTHIIFYQPIPVTGWSLGVVRVKDELSFDVTAIRHQIIWLLLSLVITLASLTVVLTARRYQAQPVATLWGRVIILSLLLVSAASAAAWLTFTPFRGNSTQATRILDRNGRDAMLNALQDVRQIQKREAPQFVPTGIYMQTMEFSAPHHLFVTGYIWQKRASGKKRASGQQQISEGVHLPTAISATITEAYRHQEGPIETVGWYFEATLRQNMNYSKYPFANETIRIPIWPKDFNTDIVLIPDLDAYTFLNPTSLPALKRGLQLHGWSIKRSFFTFDTHEFETDFGMAGYHSQEDLPELRFNLEVQRNLLDAMINHIIPIILVAIMLFVVLVTSTKDELEAKRLGFNPSGVMRLGSGLLFVLLISHIQLRNAIQVEQVMFMEYYFFIMYLMIIFTSLHSLLFNLKTVNIPIVDREQSLLFKLLYWPLLFGLQLLVTVLIFY